MIIINDNIKNIHIHDNLSIALGTFDGVHFGHQQIINKAKENSIKYNIKSAVVTFDIHPYSVLFPQSKIDLIYDNYMKTEVIKSLNVDYLIFIKFNKELADIEADKFLFFLMNNLNVKSISCGYNYTFGKNKKGNTDFLSKYSKILNFKLSIVDMIRINNEKVSSSLIRKYLSLGNIRKVNSLLGYKYYFIGNIVHGNNIANKLGFPTANLSINSDICMKNGVYITQSVINKKTYNSISNVGYAPTIRENKLRTIETFIFDFNDDIYDFSFKVIFLDYIRGEVKFTSTNDLQERVMKDVSIAKIYFTN